MNARVQPTPRRVLLLAAHPNDEVGIAATLGTHARAGVPITIVTLLAAALWLWLGG